jgi:hypothetical protein
MESLVSALKDTPIPTILVIAGIFFLILAVADQIAGKVVIDPSRRKNAVAIGALLLVTGVALQFVPRSPSSPAVLGPGAPDAKHTATDSTPPSAAGPKSPELQSRQSTPANHGGDRPTVGPALNDSIATARRVEIPSTTHEKRKLVGDKRYFKFMTTDQPPEKIRVVFRDLNRGNDTYPTLIVFDPDEREIFNDWNVGSGNLVFVFSPKAAATYFILARQQEKHALVPAEYEIVIEAE